MAYRVICDSGILQMQYTQMRQSRELRLLVDGNLGVAQHHLRDRTKVVVSPSRHASSCWIPLIFIRRCTAEIVYGADRTTLTGGATLQ